MATRRDYDTADDALNVRCEHCRQRIGVYDPVIALRGGLARRTSRAAEPLGDAAREGTLFHAACYDGPDFPISS